VAPLAHVSAGVAVLSAGVEVLTILAVCIGLLNDVFRVYLGEESCSTDVDCIGVVGANAAAGALDSDVLRGEPAAEVPSAHAANQTCSSKAVADFTCLSNQAGGR
jgi:hypothetical protein